MLALLDDDPSRAARAPVVEHEIRHARRRIRDREKSGKFTARLATGTGAASTVARVARLCATHRPDRGAPARSALAAAGRAGGDLQRNRVEPRVVALGMASESALSWSAFATDAPRQGAPSRRSHFSSCTTPAYDSTGRRRARYTRLGKDACRPVSAFRATPESRWGAEWAAESRRSRSCTRSEAAPRGLVSCVTAHGRPAARSRVRVRFDAPLRERAIRTARTSLARVATMYLGAFLDDTGSANFSGRSTESRHGAGFVSQYPRAESTGSAKRGRKTLEGASLDHCFH